MSKSPNFLLGDQHQPTMYQLHYPAKEIDGLARASTSSSHNLGEQVDRPHHIECVSAGDEDHSLILPNGSEGDDLELALNFVPTTS